MLGKIHSLESFGTVDGPGTRFVVFTKGCPMRCLYCHNPDTWDQTGATEMDTKYILEQYHRNESFYMNGGGITVTGGEPLVQIDFVTELFELCRKEGVNTCIDTSGNPFTREGVFFEKFRKLCELTDLFILDIKHIDDEAHKKLTGCSNKNILDMAEYLSDNGKEMWIRHVLVPGITTFKEDQERLAAFIKTLKTVSKVEVLPYHRMGVPEYERLGIKYTLPDTLPPSKEELEKARALLEI